MTKPVGFDQIGFQIVWLISAAGAARELSWPGITASTLLLGCHVGWTTGKRSSALVIVTTGAVGLLAETALVASGLIAYSAAWPSAAIAPAWIVTLWLAFAVMIAPLRRTMGSHALAKSALLGCATGPFSYLAAERMGAAALPPVPTLWLSYLAVAVIWGLALPLLMMAEQRFDAAAVEPSVEPEPRT